MKKEGIELIVQNFKEKFQEKVENETQLIKDKTTGKIWLIVDDYSLIREMDLFIEDRLAEGYLEDFISVFGADEVSDRQHYSSCDRCGVS